MLVLLAAALPVLYWQAGPDTASALKQAGITRIAVTAAQVDSWKRVPGISVESADIQSAIKLPEPGVAFHMNRATASRVPWVNSNGWQFIRKPEAHFYYDVTGDSAALAAAEAFCFGSTALVKTDSSGLKPLADMLKFLDSIPRLEGKPLADIGFVDDGSPVAAEVMNLMVRDNLLFKIVPAPQPGMKLTVRIGSKEYPRNEAANPDAMVQKIRANLTDAQRSIRIYGTSVVVAHVTSEAGKVRIQLLNYGAAHGIKVGAFRVRILGRYSKSQLRSFGDATAQVSDYDVESGATEFTVPELKTYAAVDLSE